MAANAVIVAELAEELRDRGHEVTVVTSFPHYASNSIDVQSGGRIVQKDNRNGIRVLRTYVFTSSNKKSILVRILNYVSFNVLSTLVGVFSGPQDIIIAPSPPLTIGITAYIISRVKRIPYIYNVQDIYPDVAIRLGALKNKWVIAFSRWMERFVYAKAKRVTVLSEGFRTNLLQKGVPEGKVTTIPNFVDTDFIRPMPRQNGFRDRHGLGDKFVVLYAGNMGHSQNLEDVLRCAEMVQDISNIQFWLVGNGSRKPYFESLSREMNLGNVRLLPFLPREEVPELYAASDVCLVTIRKGIALESVPSKAYTIMSAARPVIAAVDRGSDTWTLIEEADCGVCIEPEDPAAMAEAVRQLYEDRENARRLGDNGRAHVVKLHTRQAIGEMYHRLLQSTVGKTEDHYSAQSSHDISGAT